MPLTLEQRRQKVIEAGLDPNEYDYQEPINDLDLFNAPKPPEPVIPEQMGVMDAVLSRLKRAIAPGLAALPGVKVGAGLGAAGGPVGSIAGGLLGGLITGGGASLAQEPILKLIQGEEDYAKGLEEYNRAGVDRPVVSTLTDVAGGSVGMSPTLQGVRGVGRMMAGVPFNKLGKEFAEPVINSAIGGGVNAGLEAAHQAISEEEMSPLRILAAGGMGSLFNDPNRLGRKLMGIKEPIIKAPVSESPVAETAEPLTPEGPNLPGGVINDPTRQLPLRRIMGDAIRDPLGADYMRFKESLEQAPILKFEAPVTEIPVKPKVTKEEIIPEVKVTEPKVEVSVAEEKLEVPSVKPEPYKPTAPPPEDFVEHPILGEDGKPIEEKPKKTKEKIQEDPTERFYQEAENIGGKYWLTPASELKAVKDHETGASEILKKPFSAFAENTTELYRKGYARIQEMGNVIYVDADKLTPGQLRELKNIAIEKKKYLLNDRVKNGPQRVLFDPNQGERIYQESPDKPSNLTDDDKSFGREFASKRGVKLEESPEIISTVSGKPARGFSAPASRVAGVSDIATRDTAPHEIGGHQYLSDLRKSKLQADRIFAEKGLKAAGSEEALAEAVGKRIVEIKDSPLKAWVQDFWSNTKRLTRLSGDEDQINIHSRRALQDKPFDESPEFHQQANEPKDRTIPTEKSNQPVKFSEAGEDETGKAPSANIKGITSVITQIEESGHPQGKLVAKAARGFEDDFRSNTGRFRNVAEGAAKNIKDDAAAAKWMYESNYGGGKTKLSPEDLAIVNDQGPLRKMLLDVHKAQKELGMKIGGRDPISNPGYFPQMVDESVINVFSKEPGSAKATELKNDYVNHLVKQGISKEKATEEFNNYLKSITNPSGNSSPEFGALREAAGMGIPLSWAEKSAKKLMSRYTNRVARDLAYYKNVQQDPVLRSLFNVPDVNGSFKKNAEGVTPITNKGIQILFKRMSGSHTLQEKTFSSVEHGVRSLILGPTTGAANAVSAVIHSIPYLPTKDMPKIIEAFAFIKKGFNDSMDMGVNRHHITDIESGAETGVSYYADKIKQWGDIVRKYTGAQLLEQGSRAHTMMVGELTAEASWGRAMKGDVSALSFLKKFGSEGVDYKRTPPNREEILKIAANFTERVQGSYGPKGLPGYLLEPSSPAFWLLSLSKWSVERANIVKADIINPALKGDLGPLIKYTLGGLLGGAAVLEIREAFNNRRAQTPTMKELEVEGDAGDYAYKATEILNAAGYGGLLLDIAKMVADKANKNRVRVPNIPTVDISSRIIEDLANAELAVQEGQDRIKTYLNFAMNTVVNTVQAARVVKNNLDPEEAERADKNTNLRVFKKLTDKPVGEAQQVNPYKDADTRDFKRAKNLEEAKKILKEEILPRLAKLSKEDRVKKLEGLRRNSIQSVPADQKEAREYYNYLVKTQGQREADLIFQSAKDQKKVNQQKSQIVPRK